MPFIYVLFVIVFCCRDHTTSFEEEILNKVAYADDEDFIGQNCADIKKIQEVLKKYELTVDTVQTIHSDNQ